MKTKKFMMLLAVVLLSGASAFAQSGNETQKGDVNEDGVVDVADINAVIEIMKEGGGTGEPIVYYWYVGHENPMEMTSITPLPSNDVSEGAGWRTIGTTLPEYSQSNPLWSSSNDIITASSKSTMYVALPSDNIKSRNDINGSDVTGDGWTISSTKKTFKWSSIYNLDIYK